MTESEWQTCDDPKSLLAAAMATPEVLRQIACRCCRRMLDQYPDDWSTRVFTDDGGYPGGYISPDDWRPRVLSEAVTAAERWVDGGLSEDALQLARKSAAEASTYSRWQWANHRLGDSATGAEYEVGFVAWKCSDAVAACCAEDICGSIGTCLSSAAEAVGFRWNDSTMRAAIAAESAAQAGVIRELIQCPKSSSSSASRPPTQ